MKNIVERLRKYQGWPDTPEQQALVKDAADEIERLRALTVGASVGAENAEYLDRVLTDLRYRRDTLEHTSVDLDWIIKRLERVSAVGASVGAGSEIAPEPDLTTKPLSQMSYAEMRKIYPRE